MKPSVPEPALEVEHPIVIFDGVCNFCSASVNFLLSHDRAGVFRFAPLQSDAGRRLLEHVSLPPLDADTFVLIEGDRHRVRSDAAIAVARRLPAPWRWAASLAVLPPAWRDALYRLIARNRYRWFGRRQACMVPSPEVRSRFLE